MSAFELADYLRLRLRTMDLTTTEAARRSGISRQTWHKLLRADISEARLSTLVQVAETLETHPLSMLRIYFNDNTLNAGSKPTARNSKRYASGFVADVTFPDYSLVQPGQEFEKIWEIVNLGAEPWVGWRLQCIDADARGAVGKSNGKNVQYGLQPETDSIAIPDTQPGEHVKLGVQMRAPNSPCTAVSRWKCVNAKGQIVFPKLTGLYCMVKVVNA